MKRRLAAALVLLLLAGLGYWLLRPTAQPTDNEAYGLILLIDGAHGGVWKRYAEEGKLPNVKRIFIDNGVWVDNATTVFPTITGAGMPSALTGTIPARHGIVSLYFFDRAKREYPVLYVALEAFDWNDWLAPGVKTIWEHFPGDDDTIAIGPALSRGADTVVSFLWNLEYKPMEYRTKAMLGLRKLERKVSGKPPARLTVAYNGWFDHMEHQKGATAPDMDEHYKAIDDLIGESVKVFNATMDKREKELGVPVKRYIALVSDHGHQDIHDVYSLDKFVRRTKAAKIADKDWTEFFGVKLKGDPPTDLASREIVVAAGEGHALLYLPTPVVSEDGTVQSLDWDSRPTLEQLRNYPFRGTTVDVVGEGTAWREAVKFMLGKDWETGAVHVFGPDGEATIERRGEGSATRAEYRYQVVGGKDPLGYTDHPLATELVGEEFHHADVWQNATYDSDAPDGIVMLHQAFDFEERAPDLYLSAAPHISIGDLVDGAKSASKHGGLTRDEAWATVAFAGSEIPKSHLTTARNIDVVPTMLNLLGQAYDADDIDGRVLELRAKPAK